MDINRTVIADDYEGLLSQYNNLKCELDVIKQQLYDTTRQARLNEALLKDYQNEIELLQKSETVEKNKWESKINRLEDTLTNLRLKHSEDILQLETELAQKQQENESLKSHNEILKQTNLAKQQAETSINCDETLSLRNNYELLLEKHEELEEAFGISQIKQIQMEKDIEQYKEELEQFKELYEDKRSEIVEYAALNEKLNEELLYAQRELENSKNKPLEENSKGNSLFAEVDDRRIYLQKTVNDMKSDYIRMKQERSYLLKQISNLRKENVDIQTRWRKDIEQIEEDKQMVSDSLQSHLTVLEDIIDKQKLELEEKPKSTADNLSVEYKFYQDMIDCKHQEVKELEEKLSKKSLGEYLLTSSLAQANKEIRQLRLKLMEKQRDEKGEICKDAPITLAPQPVEVYRTHIKGSSKAKDKEIKEQCHEETLTFHQPQDNSSNIFNIFNNRDIKKDNLENIKIGPESELQKIDKIALDDLQNLQNNEAKVCEDQTLKIISDQPQKTKCNEDKENVIVKQQPIKIKKAVTFSDDTVDTNSGLARRKGTRIFSAPKKMF